MKYISKLIVVICVGLSAIACDYDRNEGFDIRSPQGVIVADTILAAKGSVVTLKATLTDESGLKSYNLQYTDWDLKEEKVRINETEFPKTYEFRANVIIPDSAKQSWIESYQKNDGTTFNVTQTYHKISLTFFDAVNNSNVVYFYIKIQP